MTQNMFEYEKCFSGPFICMSESTTLFFQTIVYIYSVVFQTHNVNEADIGRTKKLRFFSVEIYESFIYSHSSGDGGLNPTDGYEMLKLHMIYKNYKL